MPAPDERIYVAAPECYNADTKLCEVEMMIAHHQNLVPRHSNIVSIKEDLDEKQIKPNDTKSNARSITDWHEKPCFQ
jgi:hypothetical protein